MEQRIRERLTQLDTLLDVQWFPYAVFNQRHKDFEGRYALVCKWPQGDARWALFQSGEIEHAFDMLGWFCTDLHDANSTPVGLDAIDNKVFELLASCDGTRIPHAKRMAQILEKNDKLKQSRIDKVLDQAGEIAKDLHYMSGHVEAVTLDRIKKQIIEEGNHGG